MISSVYAVDRTREQIRETSAVVTTTVLLPDHRTHVHDHRAVIVGTDVRHGGRTARVGQFGQRLVAVTARRFFRPAHAAPCRRGAQRILLLAQQIPAVFGASVLKPNL